MIINSIITAGSNASSEVYEAVTPLAADLGCSCIFNNEVYVICTNLTFWRFDLSSKTWIQLTSCNSGSATTLRVWSNSHSIYASQIYKTSGYTGREAGVCVYKNGTWTKYLDASYPVANSSVYGGFATEEGFYHFTAQYSTGAYIRFFNGTEWTTPATTDILPPPVAFNNIYYYQYYNSGNYDNLYSWTAGETAWTNLGQLDYRGSGVDFVNKKSTNQNVMQNESLGMRYHIITNTPTINDFKSANFTNTFTTGLGGFILCNGLLNDKVVYVSKNGILIRPI